MTSFSIQTFGCRVNQAEAFLWADVFQKHGLKYEENFYRSDLVVINTCTLTSRADSDLRGFIRKVCRLNPKARLVVSGCYAERAPEELKKIPQVWCIFSNKEKENLTGKVLSLASSKKTGSVLPFRSRALVKVQDGCNFRCTFCIIPSVRGRSVSLGKEGIIAQIKEFVSQGFKEIVLTGIHLCSYGLDLKPRSSLLQLLREIEGLDGLARVRLSSLDPRFVKPPLVEHFTSSRKICPHFHLSLQSGSERILQRMGRNLKIEDYKQILSCLREKSSKASLGADIIAGFPGEDEDDFQKTYSFLEHSPLTYFHVFAYSPRPGTAAALWQQTGSKVTRQRAALLRDLSKRKNTGFRQFFLGKECQAVVIKKENSGARVLTSNYIKVFVPSCAQQEKDEVRVRITEVDSRETTGQVIDWPGS